MLFKFLGSGDDKRRHRRRDYDQFSSIQIGGSTIRGQLIDLSEGGCLFRPEFSVGFVTDKRLVLSLLDARIDCELVRRSSEGLHCRFLTALNKRQLDNLMTAKSQAMDSRTRVAGRGDDPAESSAQDRWRQMARPTGGPADSPPDKEEVAAPHRPRPLAAVTSSLFRRLRRDDSDEHLVEQDRSHILARLRQPAKEPEIVEPEPEPEPEPAEIAQPTAEPSRPPVEEIPQPPPAPPPPPVDVAQRLEPVHPPAPAPAPAITPPPPPAPHHAPEPPPQPEVPAAPEQEWRRQMARERLRRKLEDEASHAVTAVGPLVPMELIPSISVPRSPALEALRASLEAELAALSLAAEPLKVEPEPEPEPAPAPSPPLGASLEALHRRLTGDATGTVQQDDRLEALHLRLAQAMIEEPPPSPPETLATAEIVPEMAQPVAPSESAHHQAVPKVSAPEVVVAEVVAQAVEPPQPQAVEPSPSPVPVRHGLRHLLGEPPLPDPEPERPRPLSPPPPVAKAPPKDDVLSRLRALVGEEEAPPPVEQTPDASDESPTSVDDMLERLRALVGGPNLPPATEEPAESAEQPPVSVDDMLEQLRQLVDEPAASEDAADEEFDSDGMIEDMDTAEFDETLRYPGDDDHWDDGGDVPPAPPAPPVAAPPLRYPGDDEDWTPPAPLAPPAPPVAAPPLRYPGDDEDWTPPAPLAPPAPPVAAPPLRYPGDDEDWTPPAPLAPPAPPVAAPPLRYPGDDEDWTPPAPPVLSPRPVASEPEEDPIAARRRRLSERIAQESQAAPTPRVAPPEVTPAPAPTPAWGQDSESDANALSEDHSGRSSFADRMARIKGAAVAPKAPAAPPKPAVPPRTPFKR